MICPDCELRNGIAIMEGLCEDCFRPYIQSMVNLDKYLDDTGMSL